MPEKHTSFEHVVGKGLTPEHKEKILKYKEKVFESQEFKDLKDIEKEKTPEELEIIELANEEINKLLRKFDLKEFNIPAKNIHIVPADKWPEGEEYKNTYKPLLQAITIKGEPFNTTMALETFHEMLHFKSYASVQLKDEAEKLEEYRHGLTIQSRTPDKKTYFDNLNEGLTEELSIRFIRSLDNHPLFKDEIAETKRIIKEYPEATKDKGTAPLFTEDTYLVTIASKEETEKRIEIHFNAKSFHRKQERRILNILIDKLLERNKDKFKNRDEILDIFTNAMLSGNIIPLGRLIDEVFGRKTFSKIGELDDDRDKLEEYIEKL